MSSSVLLLSVGIFLGSLPLDALAAGIGTTSSKLNIPRIGINRSSKDNGGSLSYTGAEYATHRPYKVDFDLLRASDQSHELEMPLLRNNDIMDESIDSDFILDPTLRSRRRRRRQVESQQQQQQAPLHQLGLFHGPIPVQRQQRPQYDNIHVKYPYPYPPTDIGQPVQVVVPESGNTGSEPVDSNNGGATTDIPSDGSQTTLLPEAPAVEQQPGAGQQDPEAPASSGKFPDSPMQQQQESSPGSAEVIQTTTYNPAVMISSSPLPPSSSSESVVDLSTPSPSQGQQPPGPPQGGSVPVSPDQQNDPASFQQPPPPLPIQVQQSIPQPPPPQPDLSLLKRLREQEEEIRRLQSQNSQLEQTNLQSEEEIRRIKSELEQANLQVVSYEQENGMVKDQVIRSEEANVKLRDRVLQLENTNQHLQEHNGQLQQVTAEQRQQINGLKASVKEAKDQLDNYQNQVNPLSEELQKNRKEIEDFLIRIRKLGEENETCKKQVRLYQLKVNYIMDQQRQQQQQKQHQPQQQQPQPQKKKQPSSSSQQFKQPTAADLTVHDDELDPELSRMDAEIAALQKNADEVAAAIQNLPEPPVLPEQAENASPVAAVVPESALPPAASAAAAVAKKENEFPGEAVQVDPKLTKHKQQQETEQKIATAADVARAESASRTMAPGSAPAWEQPAGF